MIQGDSHLHTMFSFDSEESPIKIIERAISLGLKAIYFTDHEDKDCICEGAEVIVDMNSYVSTILSLKEKYKDKIDIRLGIEIGLQPHLHSYFKDFSTKYPFDFIIGSIHLIGGEDPYYPSFWENSSDVKAYHDTWITTLNNINVIDDFDVLGHFDYIVRYGRRKEESYIYTEIKDIVDEILKVLIQRGKGLEVNTAGLRSGLSFCHPRHEILTRYKELGGEIITIGSDAHLAEDVAYKFQRAEELLQQCGFQYYTEFIGRKPYFCKI